MQPPKKDDDLNSYRTGKLTVLQLLSLLAIAGLVATLVVHYLF